MQQTFLENAYKIWNEWEIRILVLLSFSLQILLILLGSRRHYVAGSWISILVWLSYLSADTVATLSLGILARNQYQGEVNKEPNNALMGLWAPFLLLHLGGPDTITAYSLEDNELWLRHLLGLLTQVTMAFYILFRSWSNAANVSFVNIPVFLAEIIKYAERTWVLRSASTQEFESSMLSASVESIKECLKGIPPEPDAHFLHQSYYWFENQVKYLFADLNPYEPTIHEANDLPMLAKDDLRMVELQLKFLYDVLYTKAPLIFSRIGLCLPLICSLSLVSALLIFSIFENKQIYSKTNVYITYCLLIGSVSLDIWAFVMLILSDWTMLWLTRHKNMFPDSVYKSISRASLAVNRDKRWSRKMPQHNLIDFCIKNRTANKCSRSKIMLSLKTKWDMKWEYVEDHLIEIIHDKVEQMNQAYHVRASTGALQGLLDQKGGNVFAKYEEFKDIKALVDETTFNSTVAIWHIATTIWFYLDGTREENSRERTVSKQLSDYMFCILVTQPTLLPKWYGGVVVMEDTNKEALSLFCEVEKEALVSSNNQRTKETLIRALLQKKHYYRGNMSVFKGGCNIAKEYMHKSGRKWSFLSEFWLEMLIHAAAHCGWRDHAQQLTRGGELLTHVSLFLANRGLSYHCIAARNN